MDGFERRIEQAPRQQQQQVAGSAGGALAGGAQALREQSIRRVGEAVQAARAARPTSILMDHSELPRPERTSRWGAGSGDVMHMCV